MRRIGLLGGMSWESSAEYYRLLNELVRERLGGLRVGGVPALLGRTSRRSRRCRPRAGGRRPARGWPTAARVAGGGRRRPAAAVHEHDAQGRRRGREAARRSRCCTSATPPPTPYDGRGSARVGLLGTAFTMEQDFYRDRLASHGLTVLVPEAEDRALVHRVIYDELCVGVVRPTPPAGRTSTWSAGSPTPAPRGSCWAAPRSSCSSRRTTSTCRCSPPPGCTSRPPSTRPSTRRLDTALDAARRSKPFLLLGTRDEDAAADNEYDAFLRFSGLEESTLHRVRMERRPLGPSTSTTGRGSSSAAARSTPATRTPPSRRCSTAWSASSRTCSTSWWRATSRSSAPATASA